MFIVLIVFILVLITLGILGYLGSLWDAKRRAKRVVGQGEVIQDEELEIIATIRVNGQRYLFMMVKWSLVLAVVAVGVAIFTRH